MGKYDQFFENMSEKDRVDLLDKITKAYEEKKSNVNYNSQEYIKIADEVNAWETKGVDLLDTALIGPFTAKEFLAKLGMDLGNYSSTDEKMHLLKVLEESQAVLRFERKKNENGLVTIEPSEALKAEMDAMSAHKDDRFSLNLWDKFCAFFGIKTEHALSVEMNIATVETYKQKQKEITNQMISAQLSGKAERIAISNGATIDANKQLLSSAKDKFDGWNQVFFGNKDVPDYILNDGKKVSALSLCMAALQQRVNMDLSAMEPEEMIQRMSQDAKLQKGIKSIGDTISNMAEKKAKAAAVHLKLKYLNDYLFETSADVSALDDKLRNLIKSGKSVHKFDVTIAADYNGMTWDPEVQADKTNLFGKAAVMFKTKDDLLKLYGENDSVFGMKDANGQPTNKAAADLENNVKNTFKSVKLANALQRKDYDTVLKLAGFGDDYSKLNEALDYADKTFRQLGSEMQKGIMSTEATNVRNTTNIETKEFAEDVFAKEKPEEVIDPKMEPTLEDEESFEINPEEDLNMIEEDDMEL